MSFKKLLAITVPISIILFIVSMYSNWVTIGTLSLIYAIVGGIMWKFAKYT